MSAVTRILEAVAQGDRQAANELLPLIYDELRQLAAQYLAHERPGQTLPPTALVHEAYLRLIGPANADGFVNRSHFFGAAAEAMRRVLIDHARSRQRHIRGGRCPHINLGTIDAADAASSHPYELLELNDALDALAAQDQLAGELFKLRYFAGFSIEQAAEMLSLSRSEAFRRWTFLRAWLGSHYGDTDM